MTDMEHMLGHWVPVLMDEDDGTQRWYVVAEPHGWYICGAVLLLPGDEDGQRTMQAICDAHNRGLKKVRTAKRRKAKR